MDTACFVKGYQAIMYEYVQDVIKSGRSTSVNGVEPQYLLPTNGNKYLVLITVQKDFLYLYFCSSDVSNLQKNLNNETPSQFFIECDIRNSPSLAKNADMLLEGYVYSDSIGYTFSIIDILVHKGKIQDHRYDLRYLLLNEIFGGGKIDMFNDTNYSIQFEIAPLLEYKNKDLLDVFLANYHLGEDTKKIVYIYNEGTEKSVSSLEVHGRFLEEHKTKLCRVEETNLTEVYKVFDYKSSKYLGLLYVPTLKEARELEETCSREGGSMSIECKYNSKFKKWQKL